MNKAITAILSIAASVSLVGLTACDSKVSERDAGKAGEILKKWQDQNRK